MNKIIDAALAVVERWDSPRWSADRVHTSELIQALRESIREYDLGCEQNTHQSDEYELWGQLIGCYGGRWTMAAIDSAAVYPPGTALYVRRGQE